MACSFVGDYVVTTKDAIDTLIKHGKGTGAYRAVKEKAIQSWRNSVEENMNAFSFFAGEFWDLGSVGYFTDAAGQSFCTYYLDPFLRSDDLLELPKYAKNTLLPTFAKCFAERLSRNPDIACNSQTMEFYADLVEIISDGWKPHRYAQIEGRYFCGKAASLYYGGSESDDEDDDEVCWD